MPKFQPGNNEAAKRKTIGRPRKMARTIAEVCTDEELTKLLRSTYTRAMRGEPAALTWFLAQMPRVDNGARLPPGLPKLDSLSGCMLALTAIGDLAVAGKITVAEADRAASLVSALGAARASLLTRFAAKLDDETRALIERERQLAGEPPSWSPVGSKADDKIH